MDRTPLSLSIKVFEFELELACQVRVTVGDSGLCCCVHVTSFER